MAVGWTSRCLAKVRRARRESGNESERNGVIRARAELLRA